MQSPRLCLAGAPLDTGNLGVSALGQATLAAVAERVPHASITILDHAMSPWRERMDLPGGSIEVVHQGAWLSRRVLSPESLLRAWASSRVNGSRNPNVRAMAAADAVWDLSGGDSFSDIYGQRRFLKVTIPKLVALRRARRLVLLPQTYGPFRRARNRRAAQRIVATAAQAWARDEDSHDRLRELAADDFDPDRHRLGVDVAFVLPALRPASQSLGPLASWLEAGHPVVGVNVSGLLSSPEAAGRFGLRASHADAMHRLVRRFLDQTDNRVLLVPHVLGTSEESDTTACRRLATSLDDPRVAVLDGGFDARTTKWVISRLDWVTGARMHATIAALSSTTPVTGIAYSDKMRGVFASCGIGDQVVDARTHDTQDLVDALWAGYLDREVIQERLRARVPGTVAIANTMFDDLVASMHVAPA